MANKKLIEVQSPVSRFESLRMQLSDMSWKQGFGNYFLENIPCDFPASKFFAARLGELVKALYKKKDKKPFRIYEFGAGMGFLAKNTMDYLKDTYPEIHKNTLYYLTDSSIEVIEKIKKCHLFDEHKGHVPLNIINASAPGFTKDNVPDLIISIYLLDALPSRYIEVKNGRIYEIQVSSCLPSEAFIFDASQIPPQILKVNDVRNLLRSEDTLKKIVLSRKILSKLVEKYTRIPLEDITNMTQAERTDLISFVKHLNPSGTIRFNYSYAVQSFLKNILKIAGPDLMYYCYDLGYSHSKAKPAVDKLILKTGTTSFYGVFFPYLNYLLEKKGFSSIQNKETEGDSREVLAFNKANLTLAKSLLKSISTKNEYHKRAQDCQKISKLQLQNTENSLETVIEMAEKLTPSQKDNHTYLSMLAKYFLMKKKYYLVPELAERNLKKYHDLDYESLMLLGKTSMAFNYPKKAEKYFKEAGHLSQFVPSAYYELALLFLRKRDTKRFISYAKRFLKYTRNDKFWQVLLLLALVYYQTSQVEKARSISNWINKVIKLYPKLVPKDIFPILAGLKQYEKTKKQ
ncbi:SAM-dependent methyltransferase [Candidatus Margulisiibacteriota bacterium]